MPRRQHNSASILPVNPLISFLTRTNCVFYSPLSQYDTSDWISGNSVVPYGNGSMVWTTTSGGEQIWQFQYISGQPYNSSQYYAKWTLQNSYTNINPLYSCCAEFIMANSSTGSVYDLLPTRYGLSLDGTNNTLTCSAQVLDIINNKSTQYRYRDGQVVFTYNYNSVSPISFNGIRIGCPAYNNASYLGPFCIRNIAFFLKALSLNEINEYFSLINPPHYFTS